MNQSNALIIGAAILGVSILGAGFLIKAAVDDGTEQVANVTEALGEVKGLLASAARPQPQQAARRRGPDPSKRYTLNVKNAPAVGTEMAKVTIVEFSDFQ